MKKFLILFSLFLQANELDSVDLMLDDLDINFSIKRKRMPNFCWPVCSKKLIKIIVGEKVTFYSKQTTSVYSVFHAFVISVDHKNKTVVLKLKLKNHDAIVTYTNVIDICVKPGELIYKKTVIGTCKNNLDISMIFDDEFANIMDYLPYKNIKVQIAEDL